MCSLSETAKRCRNSLRDKVDGPQNEPKRQHDPEFALFEPMKHGDIESIIARRPHTICEDGPKEKYGCCDEDRMPPGAAALQVTVGR